MAHKRLAAHLRRVVAAVGRVAVRHREALRPIAGHIGLGPEEPLRVDVGGPQVGPPVDQDLVSLVALPRRLLPHVRTSVILHRLGGTPRLRRTITRLPHTNARSCICCCQSRNGTSTSIASARARGPGFGQQTTHPRWRYVRRAAAHQACRGGRVGGATSVEGAAAASVRGPRPRGGGGAGSGGGGASGDAGRQRPRSGKLRTNLNLNAVRPEKRTLRTSSCHHRPRARGLGLGGRATTSWACVAAQAGPLARSEGQARRQQAAAWPT